MQRPCLLIRAAETRFLQQFCAMNTNSVESGTQSR